MKKIEQTNSRKRAHKDNMGPIYSYAKKTINMTIKLPYRFDFFENIEDWLCDFKRISNLGRGKDLNSLQIDMTESNHFDFPSGFVAIAFLQALHWRDNKSINIKLNKEKDTVLHRLANISGIDNEKAGGSNVGKNYHFESKQVYETGSRFDQNIIKPVFDALLDTKEFSAALHTAVTRAYQECLQNTLDHAYPSDFEGNAGKNRYWTGVFCDQDSKHITLVHLDRGIGIPKSMRTSKFHKNLASLSDSDLITRAMKRNVSSKKQTGRGDGLPNIDHCRHVEDADVQTKMIVASAGAVLISDDEKTNIKMNSTEFDGTLIVMEFTGSRK